MSELLKQPRKIGAQNKLQLIQLDHHHLLRLEMKFINYFPLVSFSYRFSYLLVIDFSYYKVNFE